MFNHPVDLPLRKRVLKDQACFSRLNELEIEDLAKLLTEKKFSPGQVIVREGEPVDSFYLIVSGQADVRKVLYDHLPPRDHVVASLSADNHDAIGLNETGFYSLSGLRTATVVAHTEVTTLFLSIPLFHGFSLAYPHVNEIMREQSSQFIFRK